MRLPRFVASLVIVTSCLLDVRFARAQPAPTPQPDTVAPVPVPDIPPPAPVAPPPSAAPSAPGTPPLTAAAAPPDATKAVAAEFTSLRVLRSKGVISQEEYDSALRDLGETSGMRAGDGNTFVLGKWATTLYGFVEADGIYDTTQSLNEIAGNTQIMRPGTFGGDHNRAQFSIRNSRLGFRLKAPETNGIRTSAQLEMDFFGGPAPASGAEATVFNNPVLRVRHMNMKIETPIVDFMLGQYWTLFGWQALYLPATIGIQGVPGGIFSRQVQARVSKTITTSAFTFEAAIAALRPPQRDSARPAGQAGLRFALNNWTAPQTANFTGTAIQPLSVAVTGDLRSVRIPEFAEKPSYTNSKMGGGVAVDAFIPVIPGGKETKGNSLALNGELSTGSGTSDLYTSQGGGVANPALPIPMGGTTAPTFDPHIDGGIAIYDPNGALHLVQWTAFLVGIQYYFPGSGNLFASANYSRTQSSNTTDLGTDAKTRKSEEWFDFNLYWDLVPSVRFGAEYAHFRDVYNDGGHAINNRGQLSAAFLF
jgi:hypothetical protein